MAPISQFFAITRSRYASQTVREVVAPVEIAAAISDVRSNILNVEARTADERGTIDITVEIPDMKHLERVISSVKKIDGVYDVSRSTRVVSPAR